MDISTYRNRVLGFYKNNKSIAVLFIILVLLVCFVLAYKLDTNSTSTSLEKYQETLKYNSQTPPTPPIPEKASKEKEDGTRDLANTTNEISGPGATQDKNNSSESDNSNNDNDNKNSGDNPVDEPTPAPDKPESLSTFVAFYSDNQSDTDEEDARHQKVVGKIMASGANPIFHAGDLMENGTQDSMDRFVSVAGSMLASRNFYGALGNNDRKVGDSSAPSPIYLDYFNFPGNERWYSINSGNLHLVVLDSAFAYSSPEQLSWLESDLQSSASRDRITGIVFHHPSFATTISSYMVNNHVDFVIYGHGHTYVKNLVDGIYQFMLPGGGSLGYALGSVYETYINLKFYNADGGLLGSQTVQDR